MEVRASLPRLDPGERQGHDGGSDGDELDRPKPPVSRPKPNVVAVPMDDDPEAVVFQLVQPSIAGRHDSGEDGPSGADEPRRLAPGREATASTWGRLSPPGCARICVPEHATQRGE